MFPESILPGALKSEDEHRRDMCAVGRWIYDRGYVASMDGNLSVRLDHAAHLDFADRNL